MNLRQRIRIMPLLVLVALLCFVVRAGEFAMGVRGGIAHAQQQVDEPVPPIPAAAEAPQQNITATEPVAEQSVESAPDQPATASPAESITPPTWRDATETDYEYSEVRAELFRDLSKRRQDIEEREKALTAREALLLAAEKELDAKLRELASLRTEIEALLQQQSEEEKARVASLVTIYEGMKAKDAARIFNTLDMDVLMTVIGAMSERKSAPILAEMNSEKARSVTILLAQERKLPEMPQQ